MTTALFDAGDFQRLDRERTLIEQRDRVPVEPDRTPDEPDFDFMLEGLIEALKRRLQNEQFVSQTQST